MRRGVENFTISFWEVHREIALAPLFRAFLRRRSRYVFSDGQIRTCLFRHEYSLRAGCLSVLQIEITTYRECRDEEDPRITSRSNFRRWSSRTMSFIGVSDQNGLFD